MAYPEGLGVGTVEVDLSGYGDLPAEVVFTPRRKSVTFEGTVVDIDQVRASAPTVDPVLVTLAASDAPGMEMTDWTWHVTVGFADGSIISREIRVSTGVTNELFDMQDVSPHAGYVGIRAEPGQPGTPGAPGEPGEPGETGDPGAPGSSAYELAVAEGFEGTEQEWLDSLRASVPPATPTTEGTVRAGKVGRDAVAADSIWSFQDATGGGFGRSLPDTRALIPAFDAVGTKGDGPLRIAVIGDSLAEGYRASGRDATWPSAMTTYAEMAGVRMGLRNTNSNFLKGFHAAGSQAFPPTVATTSTRIASLGPGPDGRGQEIDAGQVCALVVDTVLDGKRIDVFFGIDDEHTGTAEIRNGAPGGPVLATFDGSQVRGTNAEGKPQVGGYVVSFTAPSGQAVSVPHIVATSGSVLLGGALSYGQVGVTGVQVLAAGNSGSTIEGWLAARPDGGRPWLDSLAAFGPHLVLVMLGGNDSTDDPTTYATKASDLTDLIEQFCPGAGVGWMIEPPFTSEQASFTLPMSLAVRRQFAGRTRVSLVELGDMMPDLYSGTQADPQWVYTGEYHLNDLGQRYLAASMARWLSAAFPGPTGLLGTVRIVNGGGLNVTDLSQFGRPGEQLYNLSTTGVIPSGSSRPAHAAGQTFFDTALGKPLWSDGSAWHDATGTVVD